MSFLLQQIVDGLASGTAYALVALGFTIIFGVMGVLNMAQSTMIMVGPMVAISLMRSGIDSFIVLLLVAMLAAAVLSVIVERVALRPFVNLLRVSKASDSDHLTPFIATLGIVIAAQNIAARIYGTRALSFDLKVGAGQIEILGVFVSRMEILALVVAGLLVVGLEFMLRKTRLGLWMRATSDNPRAASFSGVNIGIVLTAATVIAGMLGAAGGILVAGIDTVASPFMDLQYGLKALVIMIMGGLGSVRGAVLAAMIVGLAEAITVGYIASSYRDLIVFVMLIAILLLRPRGILPVARTA